MDCEQQGLFELMQGELSFEESQNVLEHIKSCRKCSERAQIMGILADSLPSSRRPTNRRWELLVAASLLLFTIPMVFYLLLKSPEFGNDQEPDHLATQEAYPYFPLEVRSKRPGLREEAFFAYREARYGEAERLFSKVTEPDAEIWFFRGVTRYLLGWDQEATSDLERALESHRWKSAAKWYLANLSIRQGNYEKAIRELMPLASEEGALSLKARQLLEKIPTPPPAK